jgi:hypothetical protein
VSTPDTAARILRSVDPDSASLDSLHALDADALLDRCLPPDRAPLTELERWRLAYHEAGHVFAAWHFECTDLEARIRAGGTGIVRCSKIVNPVAASTFHLAGPISETRFDPVSLHKYTGKSSDFLQARLLIDDINKRAQWPILTCQRAAETAFDFVRDHWRQISNVALALESAGELNDRDVRIFAGAGT